MWSIIGLRAVMLLVLGSALLLIEGPLPVVFVSSASPTNKTSSNSSAGHSKTRRHRRTHRSGAPSNRNAGSRNAGSKS